MLPTVQNNATVKNGLRIDTHAYPSAVRKHITLSLMTSRETSTMPGKLHICPKKTANHTHQRPKPPLCHSHEAVHSVSAAPPRQTSGTIKLFGKDPKPISSATNHWCVHCCSWLLRFLAIEPSSPSSPSSSSSASVWGSWSALLPRRPCPTVGVFPLGILHELVEQNRP